jgi:hypothetical protein
MFNQEDEMPDNLKNYLQVEAQKRQPMYAQGGIIGSMKEAFKTPEAQAAVPQEKTPRVSPFSNFVNKAREGKTLYYYNPKTNQTKIVYPNNDVEIVEGRR